MALVRDVFAVLDTVTADETPVLYRLYLEVNTKSVLAMREAPPPHFTSGDMELAYWGLRNCRMLSHFLPSLNKTESVQGRPSNKERGIIIEHFETAVETRVWPTLVITAEHEREAAATKAPNQRIDRLVLLEYLKSTSKAEEKKPAAPLYVPDSQGRPVEEEEEEDMPELEYSSRPLVTLTQFECAAAVGKGMGMKAEFCDDGHSLKLVHK